MWTENQTLNDLKKKEALIFETYYMFVIFAEQFIL